MTISYPSGYYNRFDPDKNYEKHLFIAGKVLQSAELNEIQESAIDKVRSIGDAVFKDGDIIRDCQVYVNPDTGVTNCQSGLVYLRGAMRTVAGAVVNLPMSGTATIGLLLVDSIITESEDTELRDQAIGLRSYRAGGAARLKTQAIWAVGNAENTDNYFPIYVFDNAAMRPKVTPPESNMVALSLAKYDRDSAGGSYVISGMEVYAEPDDNGDQIYSISDGRARCYGYEINQRTSRRVIYAPSPYARLIGVEPHAASGGTQRINTVHTPIATVNSVYITREATVTMVHGAYLGCADLITGYDSVVEIVGVRGGGASYDASGTIYTAGSDYNLLSNNINWSPVGAEPNTGSTYYVRLRYISSVPPESPDALGFSVTGAIVGTQILVSYNYYVPRIDRICMNRDGEIVWLRGVASDLNPWAPEVGKELLPLAVVRQTWDSNRAVVRDGARMVPMDVLDGIQYKLDRLLMLTAQERLKGDASLRDQSIKKSITVDPFFDDSMRDDGQVQDAAVIDGYLMLAIDGTSDSASLDIQSPQVNQHTQIVCLEQTKRTGCMLINPYMAFAPLPAKLTLTPSDDHWMETNTVWLSPITRQLTAWGAFATGSQSTVVDVISRRSEELFIRQINVEFFVENFYPNEAIVSASFDGVPVNVTEV